CPSPLCLHRIAPAGNRAGCGQQPLTGWPLPIGPCKLAVGNRPLRPGRERLCRLLLAAARGVVVVDRPCIGPGHGRPPPFLTAFAVKTQ
ncbi:hypothetical protein B296_00015009, partial [Ensete ventricosum]